MKKTPFLAACLILAATSANSASRLCEQFKSVDPVGRLLAKNCECARTDSALERLACYDKVNAEFAFTAQRNRILASWLIRQPGGSEMLQQALSNAEPTEKTE